jgi:hypothetical protein
MRRLACLTALALIAAYDGGAAEGADVPHAGLSSAVESVRGAQGCRYRLLGFVVRHHFIYARFENGCGEPAVFNLCIRDASGKPSNRATPAGPKQPAEIGLGHVASIPDQRVRWAVDEPACRKPGEVDPSAVLIDGVQR